MHSALSPYQFDIPDITRENLQKINGTEPSETYTVIDTVVNPGTVQANGVKSAISFTVTCIRAKNYGGSVENKSVQLNIRVFKVHHKECTCDAKNKHTDFIKIVDDVYSQDSTGNKSLNMDNISGNQYIANHFPRISYKKSSRKKVFISLSENTTPHICACATETMLAIPLHQVAELLGGSHKRKGLNNKLKNTAEALGINVECLAPFAYSSHKPRIVPLHVFIDIIDPNGQDSPFKIQFVGKVSKLLEQHYDKFKRMDKARYLLFQSKYKSILNRRDRHVETLIAKIKELGNIIKQANQNIRTLQENFSEFRTAIWKINSVNSRFFTWLGSVSDNVRLNSEVSSVLLQRNGVGLPRMDSTALREKFPMLPSCVFRGNALECDVNDKFATSYYTQIGKRPAHGNLLEYAKQWSHSSLHENMQFGQSALKNAHTTRLFIKRKTGLNMPDLFTEDRVYLRSIDQTIQEFYANPGEPQQEQFTEDEIYIQERIKEKRQAQQEVTRWLKQQRRMKTLSENDV